MITIPLSLLLDTGVTLETDEAVAIVQSLVSSVSLAGAPSPDNVEISSAGVARYRTAGDPPTVPALASLLHRLLPRTDVPAGLRYTVARALGAVDAPGFSSVQDFSRALSRFERRDRAEIIQGLLSRGRPARPIASSPQPIARPIRRARARPALYAAALVLISGVAGFDVQMVRLDRLASARAAAASAVVPPSVSASANVVQFGIPIALPLFTDPARALASAEATHWAVRRNAAAIPRRPVRALPAADTPAYSPAFSSFSPGGTALFFQTGGTHDPSSAIAVARWRGDQAADLRILNIVNDGAHNYHAQPSPDGRLIAFDSDRDGVRGVYVANRDGTAGNNVRRISGDGYAALPSWSPDGSRLAFVRAEPGAPSCGC